MSREIFVCAGEASGDLHGAELLAALRRREPGLRAFGVGGDGMEAAGFEAIVSTREFGQAGLVEVLRHLPRLRELFDRVASEVERRHPAAAVLIDFPDFNLRLARRLAKKGIPIVYHVSPQLWAWRRGRIRTIRECVDRMLVLFPFEETLYRENGVPVTFVGHPVVDAVGDARSPGAPLAPGEPPRVAILPGSRRAEVRSLLPVFLEAARLLAARHPGTRFVLVPASTLPESEYAAAEGFPGLERVAGEGRYAAIRRCHAALVASGTATLELALLGVPMAIGYRLHPVSYWLAEKLVSVDHVGLVNLVAGRRIAPERLQGELEPGRLADDLDRWLVAGGARDAALADLADAVARLGAPGAGDRAAEAILSEMTT